MIDFNALRLLLALSVALAHHRLITGDAVEGLRAVSSLVAVQAFFVVSGWIVTASYRATQGRPGALAAFYVRRGARLVPLYAVVVLAQALAVVALVGWRPGDGAELWRYLISNLGFLNFLQPDLLGFPGNPRMPAINPSLWTLKIELMFYASVPLWAALARRHAAWALAGLFVASTLYAQALQPLSPELAKQLPGQLRFFAIGMACERLFGAGAVLARHRGAVLVAGLAGFVAAQALDQNVPLLALQPLAVAAFVCAAALWLPSLRRAPDLSYGVYLIHAPVMQFGLHLGGFAPGLAGLATALGVTLLLSLLACHAVERPAIEAGRRLSQRLSAARPLSDTSPAIGT